MTPVGRGSATPLAVVAVALLILTSSFAFAVVAAPSSPHRIAADQTAPGGTAAGDIPLDAANVTFAGDAFDGAGATVVGGVDVNGDGANDVLVGAPSADRDGRNSGAVFVFYGPFEAGELDADDADATLVGVRGDRAGFALAAGDFDDDGVDDVAVGAPRNDSVGRDAGLVYLVDGEDLDGDASLPAVATATLTGRAAGDLAGFSLATVDDSADPLDEFPGDALLVGAPGRDDDGGETDAGAAYLVDEPFDADGNRLEAVATATYIGATTGDLAGYAVAVAGNVSGDERPELLVGAPRNDSGGSNSGAVYVVERDATGNVSLALAVTLPGAAPGDRAGSALAGAVDPNDDGVDDVVVGAPRADRTVTDDGDVTTLPDAGAAYILYGPFTSDRNLSAANVTLTGEGADDRAGSAVAAAGSGDVSCDAVDDVLIGAPFNDSTGPDAGAAYLVYGGGPDGERSLSTAGARFPGAAAGDQAGFAVTGANDSSDDGLEDILVGAPGSDAGGDESGAAYLVFGKCPVTPTPTPSPTPTATPSPTPSPTPTATPKPDLDPVDTRVRCSADGGTLTLRNGNDVAVRVVLESPDGDTERFTLDAGERASFDELDDGEYTVRTVQRDGRAVDTDRVRVACPTERVDTDVRCTDDGGELRVRNPNDESVSVEVRGPGGAEESVTLDPGEVVRFVDLGDGEYTVTTRADIRGNDYRIGGETVVVDCAEPTFDAIRTDLACRDDGGRLLVSNGNDASVRVELRGPDGFSVAETLSPGETERFGRLADGDYVLVVSDGDRELGRERFTVDCEPPEPDLDPVVTELTCRDDGALLKVRNTNDDPVRVEIRGPDGFHESLTLDPGETEQFPGLDNGDYVVGTFDEDGEELGRERLNADCEPPEPDLDPVTLDLACRDDGGRLVVENPNADPVRVEVRGPDGFRESFVLDPEESERLGGLANGDYVVGTFDEDGEEVGRERVTVDCEPPEPDLDPVVTDLTCRDDGALLKVRNTNDDPVRVEIRGPDGISESVSVGPGETRQFDELPNGDYVVGTFDEDGEEVGRERLTADCEEPEPDLDPVVTELTCRDEGALLKVRNTNDVAVRVELRGPDGISESVTVDPGETLQFDELPNGDYVVGTFDEDGEELGRERLTADCEPPEPDFLAVEQRVRCAASGGELAVRNPNDEAVRVVVTDGEVDESFVLDPGERRDLTELPDGEYLVETRTIDGEPVGEPATLAVECPTEAVVALAVCSDGAGRLEVTNPNEEPVQLDLSGPDLERQLLLDPDETVALDELADGSYTLVTLSGIEDNNYRIGEARVTVECAEEPSDEERQAPLFVGCGRVVAYAAVGSEDPTFGLVTYQNGDIEVQQVDAADASTTYDEGHPQFGATGFTGYAFSPSGQLAGIVDPEGTEGYRNPNFDLMAGNCGDSGGIVAGIPVDWATLQGVGDGIERIETPWGPIPLIASP